MSGGASTIGPAEIKALRRLLVDARADQITRVVAMIDRLPERGEADDLLTPFRARLAEINPPRPLNFPRLLFIPIDPLIVPGPRWRRGTLGVPRTALTPLARHVGRALAEDATAIEAMIAGRSAADRAVIDAAGARLWPAAARILTSASPPPDWQDATGLPVSDHAAIAGAIAVVLAQAVPIQRLAGGAIGGVGDEALDDAEAALRAILASAAERGSQALAVMIALLMNRLPGFSRLPELAREIAAAQDKDGRLAADRATEHTLESLTNSPAIALAANGAGGLAHAAEIIAHATTMLTALAEQSSARPDRQLLIDELRRSIGRSCRDSFTLLLERHLLAPLAGLAIDDDDTITGLETVARDLRAFEQASRQAGGGELYDRILREAGTRIAATSLPRIDRMRLVEIITNSETALTLLGARPT